MTVNLVYTLYWNEIEKQEKAGLKFKEILNDVIEFEKGVILKEFQLVNSEGDLLYGSDFKKNVFQAITTCVACGFVWYLLKGKMFGGQSRTFHNFLEGFFWRPLVCILIFSIFGLPQLFSNIISHNPCMNFFDHRF